MMARVAAASYLIALPMLFAPAVLHEDDSGGQVATFVPPIRCGSPVFAVFGATPPQDECAQPMRRRVGWGIALLALSLPAAVGYGATGRTETSPPPESPPPEPGPRLNW